MRLMNGIGIFRYPKFINIIDLSTLILKTLNTLLTLIGKNNFFFMVKFDLLKGVRLSAN